MKPTSSDETPTPQGQLSNARKHLIKSAGYWFYQSRLAQSERQNPEAICCMENAYNHVENALAAAMDALQWMSANRALILFAEEPAHVTDFFKKADRFFEINGESEPQISSSSSRSQVRREKEEHGWIRTADRPPTKEDALNENEEVYCLDRAGNCGTNSWRDVRGRKEIWPFWMPIPKLPDEIPQLRKK